MPPKRKPKPARKPAPASSTPENEALGQSKSKNGDPKSTQIPTSPQGPTTTPTSFTISDPSKPAAKPISCLRYGTSDSAGPDLIFTHGAGGNLSAPAVVNFAAGFSETSSLLGFEGSSSLVSRAKSFTAVIEHERASKHSFSGALGGRSLGARAAVVAATGFVSGTPVWRPSRLVLVSYPLIGPKGDVRDEILLKLPAEVEVLFISGSKDGMCDFEKLNEVRAKMEAKSRLVVVKGADHGMNVTPKKATAAVGQYTGKVAAEWLDDKLPLLTVYEIGWDDEEKKAVRGQYHAQDEIVASNRTVKEKFEVEGDVATPVQKSKTKVPSSKDTRESAQQAHKPRTKRKSVPADLEALGSPPTPSRKPRSSKRKKTTKA